MIGPEMFLLSHQCSLTVLQPLRTVLEPCNNMVKGRLEISAEKLHAVMDVILSLTLRKA
jgi:hypothetical protein